MPAAIVFDYWLLGGIAVALVASALLFVTWKTALRIEEEARSIWTHGKLVAQNTVQIPLLQQTNQTVRGIGRDAGGILAAASAILAHATTCPGCPDCLLARRERGPS